MCIGLSFCKRTKPQYYCGSGGDGSTNDQGDHDGSGDNANDSMKSMVVIAMGRRNYVV